MLLVLLCLAIVADLYAEYKNTGLRNFSNNYWFETEGKELEKSSVSHSDSCLQFIEWPHYWFASAVQSLFWSFSIETCIVENTTTCYFNISYISNLPGAFMYLLMSVARTAPEAPFQSFPALRILGQSYPVQGQYWGSPLAMYPPMCPLQSCDTSNAWSCAWICWETWLTISDQSHQGMVLYARLHHSQELRNTAPDAACPIASPFMDAASAFASSGVQLRKVEIVRKLAWLYSTRFE